MPPPLNELDINVCFKDVPLDASTHQYAPFFALQINWVIVYDKNIDR